MSFQQLMRHEPLRHIALRVDKGDVVIDVADALQLVGVPMVVRAPVHANQEDGHVSPRETEEVEFEFVHVCGFAVEEQEQAENWRGGPCLPAVDGVVRGGLGMLAEVQFLHLLPACHDARATFDADVAPHVVEVLVVDGADVVGLT